MSDDPNTDAHDHSPPANFRRAVERITWAHSNLSTETRAEIMLEVVAELQKDDSAFDDFEAHVEHVLGEYVVPTDVVSAPDDSEVDDT